MEHGQEAEHRGQRNPALEQTQRLVGDVVHGPAVLHGLM